MTFDSDTLRAVVRLATAAAALPADRPDEAAGALLSHLTALVGARDSFLTLATLDPATADGDPLAGWRPGHVVYERCDSRRLAIMSEYRRERRYRADPLVHGAVSAAGRPRALRRRDVVDDHRWDRSPGAELLRAVDVGDRLLAGLPVGPRAEAFLVLDRAPGERPFDEAARELAHLAAEAVAPALRRIARGFGLTDSGDRLAPRERAVLGGLLSGRSEKEIAAALGLTVRSAHQVVTAVYRSFGVHSRPELMALWLSGEPLPTPEPLAPTRET